MLLGAAVHEDLGPVVDRVDGTVLLSHLKIKDTVERLPSRHRALSLFAEDVQVQCVALTPETRKRPLRLLSQQGTGYGLEISSAHAHGYLKISRHPPFARVMVLQLPRPTMTCPNSLTINLIQRLTSTIRIRMFLTLVNDDDCATTPVSARFFSCRF